MLEEQMHEWMRNSHLRPHFHSSPCQSVFLCSQGGALMMSHSFFRTLCGSPLPPE